MHARRAVRVAPPPLPGVGPAGLDRRGPRRGERAGHRGQDPFPPLTLVRFAGRASGGTGPPSSSQVSLPSQRLIMDNVGASTPDAIHAQVSAPSTGRYSASARARRKHA